MRDFLRSKLASYKVPRRVLFIREEDLALTGSSKIKYDELKQLVVRRLDRDSAADTNRPVHIEWRA